MPIENNVIKDNVGKVYLLKSGLVRDPLNLDSYHPLSTTDGFMPHIEDGVPGNIVLANYKPNKKVAWTSHWFPLWYRGLTEKEINNEGFSRTFAQYFSYIPSILVAMNKNAEQIMDVEVTIVQYNGGNLLGGYSSVLALETAHEATEQLNLDHAVAYVYDSSEKGFYTVSWNTVDEVWEWARVTMPLQSYGVQMKQYNTFSIKVQKGNAPLDSQYNITWTDEQIRLTWQEIAYLEATLAEHTELLEDLREDLDNEILNIRKTLLLATENDWNFEGEFDNVKFGNSRNGWVQVDDDFYMFGGTEWLPNDTFNTQYSALAFKYNATSRTWTQLANFPIAVNELRGVHKDGYIYLFGMNVTTPTNLDKTYRYKIADDTYELISNPPNRIRISSGAILIDDDVYVMADMLWASGETPSASYINTKPYIYNITTNTWTGTGTQANTPFDRGFSALYDGKIYVQRSLKFQSYDPVLDTWDTSLTPPTYGNVHTGLMQVYQDRLFIGSGWQSSASANNPYFQYYNVAKNKWYVMSRLEVSGKALGYGSMFLYNDKMYYIGGYSNEEEPVFNNVVRSFNLEKLRLEFVEECDIRFNELDQKIDDLDEQVNDRIDENEQDIATAQQDISDLETANMVKSIARTGTNLFTLTFYDNTTSNILTLAELKAFIGEATQSLSGLMSAQDKTDLDTLMALFDSDADNVVNTIAEILAIFEDYPEGVDLVTALAGKVDKTQIVNDLTTGGTTDVLSAEQGKVLKDSADLLEARVDVNEDDIVDLKVDVATHEDRIDKIEELTRKQTSDVASLDDDGTGIISMGKDVAETTAKVQVDGLLLNAPQLVTNGDFSDGTTGWIVNNSSLNVINDNMVATGLSGSVNVGISKTSGWATLNNNKYYYATMVRTQSTEATQLRLRTYYGSVGDTSQMTPAQNQWYLLSVLRTNTSDATGIDVYATYSVTATGKIFEINYVYAFNISTLITNKQYSPLFNTTFDLMSDANIKTQMDAWVLDGTLPNSIMAVDFNKRVRSVGKNLFDKLLYATSYAYKIKVKPSTAYVWNTSTAYKTYDINMVEVASATGTTVTTGSGTHYIAFSGITALDTFQLELGSTATTYTPYRHSDLYIKGAEKGYSYQGTKDSIEFRDGVAYLIKRVNATHDGLLTTPIETIISTIGNAMAYPNGTQYIDDMTISMALYGTNAQVEDTDYPISSLDEIYKLNTNGSKTKLAVSGATISGDGLSFTHSGLTAGDMVIFSYTYRGTNVKGLTTVYYYGDNMIVAGSGTTAGKVYKIVPTVVDENIVWTKVEV